MGYMQNITNHKTEVSLLNIYFLITLVQTLNIALHEHHKCQAVVTITFCMGKKT